MKKQKRFNIVSLTDWHVSVGEYDDVKALTHSPLAIDTAIAFCKHLQPDIIILHEVHDFYSLSKFDKDPDAHKTLQKEIDEVEKYFWALRRCCPKSRIILLNSNHLERLKKYLYREAPALNSLRNLQIEKLLNLKEYGIEYMEDFIFRNILFKHGDIVRGQSGYTARAELDKEGMSGVSGHTHRLGVHFTTKRGGKYVWIESGCLCDIKPQYIKGTANWQQGISLITFKGETNHFTPQVYPIIDGEILYGNTTITI